MQFLRFGLLLATILSVGPLNAQQAEGISSAAPAPGAPRRSISGTVMNSVTAEPIRKALVTIQSSAGERSTFSDGVGHFEIPNVADSQLLASCRKPGFVDRSNFLLNSFSSTKESVIRLVPYSVITGRVVDAAGSPVEGARIQAITAKVENGKRVLEGGPLERSNKDGHYEIDDLPAGDYRLSVRTDNLPTFQRTDNNGQPSQVTEMYAPRFAGGGLDLASAQVLHLLPGQSQEADFTLEIISSHSVSGSFPPASAGIHLMVEDSDGNEFPGGVWLTQPATHWTIDALPPGTWKVVAQTFDGQHALYGEQTVTLADKDLTNIPIPLTPRPQIPIVIKGPADTTSDPVQFTLQASALRLQRGGGGAQVYMQGSHAIEAWPGRYFLQAHATPGFCIEDVHVDGVDLNRDGLTVPPNSTPAPVMVQVRSDCSALDVQLNHPDEAKGVTILVLGPEPICAGLFALANQTGTIHLENLAPGEYRIYAFDTVDNLEYADENVLQSFRSTSVTLNPSGSSSVRLDVNKRANSNEEDK